MKIDTLVSLEDTYYEPMARLTECDGGKLSVEYYVKERVVVAIKVTISKNIWISFDNSKIFISTDIKYLKNKKDAEVEAKKKAMKLVEEEAINHERASRKYTEIRDEYVKLLKKLENER